MMRSLGRLSLAILTASYVTLSNPLEISAETKGADKGKKEIKYFRGKSDYDPAKVKAERKKRAQEDKQYREVVFETFKDYVSTLIAKEFGVIPYFFAPKYFSRWKGKMVDLNPEEIKGNLNKALSVKDFSRVKLEELIIGDDPNNQERFKIRKLSEFRKEFRERGYKEKILSNDYLVITDLNKELPIQSKTFFRCEKGDTRCKIIGVSY